MLKRFRTCELVEQVVLHSAHRPNRPLDMQDYKSYQIATTTYLGATDLPAKQEEAQSAGTSHHIVRTASSDKLGVGGDSHRPENPTFQPPQSTSMQYAGKFLEGPRNRPHSRTMANPQTPGCLPGRSQPAVKLEKSEDPHMSVYQGLSGPAVKMDPNNDYLGALGNCLSTLWRLGRP